MGKNINLEYKKGFKKEKVSIDDGIIGFIPGGGDNLELALTTKTKDNDAFKTRKIDITDLFVTQSSDFKAAFKVMFNSAVDRHVKEKHDLLEIDPIDIFAEE